MEQKEKQRLAMHIVIVVILCIPFAFMWYAIINANHTTSYKTETYTATEPRVYVTTYGERYHSAGCSYLAKSQRAMGKQEAISKGYTACSRCGGRSSGTITVTYTKKIAQDNTTKNVWGAIGLSVLCTPLAYLFIYVLVRDLVDNKRIQKTTNDAVTGSTYYPSLLNPSPAIPKATPPLPKPSLQIRVGDAVKHKTFGIGVIKKIEGKYFTVRFDHDSKDFIHPDVFDSGLMIKIQ